MGSRANRDGRNTNSSMKAPVLGERRPSGMAGVAQDVRDIVGGVARAAAPQSIVDRAKKVDKESDY